MVSPLPAPSPSSARDKAVRYVGTLVGESTSSEFRLAVAHETIREQDIIAVDAELRRPAADAPVGRTGTAATPGRGAPERIRVWAKVQRIERLNPLFPAEAGHELAATTVDPFDTVLSLSREMVTAVCQILGAEPLEGNGSGRLDHLRYPAQPASSAYRPESRDIARIVLGELEQTQKRALDLASLANRPEVDVLVDGHAIVTRHLAILAMTGAGKSWTARRIIEQLAEKNYPIVIFDPHGDYTGLADVPALRDRVRRYYAQFPVFEEDSETVAGIVDTLGYPLSDTMRTRFTDVFNAAGRFIVDDKAEMRERAQWLGAVLGDSPSLRFGLKRDMWLIGHLARRRDLPAGERRRPQAAVGRVGLVRLRPLPADRQANAGGDLAACLPRRRRPQPYGTHQSDDRPQCRPTANRAQRVGAVRRHQRRGPGRLHRRLPGHDLQPRRRVLVREKGQRGAAAAGAVPARGGAHLCPG